MLYFLRLTVLDDFSRKKSVLRAARAFPYFRLFIGLVSKISSPFQQ